MQTTPVAYLLTNQTGRWNDVFRLQPDKKVTIGRSSSNQIVVADERCSRQHTEIVAIEGKWIARDLGSRNGTIVNGEKIARDHKLSPGDVIEIAFCKITYTDTLATQAPDQNIPTNATPNSGQTESLSQSAILHRSNSAVWLSQDIEEVIHPPTESPDDSSLSTISPTGTQTTATQSSGMQPAIASALFRFAFELASEPSIESACERALAFLIQRLPIVAGGVLAMAPTQRRTESNQQRRSNRLVLLATVQSGEQPYHRANEQLTETVLQNGEAVLVRNFDDDGQSLEGGLSNAAIETNSVICAPIIDSEKNLGLLHVFSNPAQTPLDRDHLDIALAVAQTLAVVFTNLKRQTHLQQKLKESNKTIENLQKQISGEIEIVGQSPALLNVKSQVARVAPTDATVLVRGESGVGKELVARSIHLASKRSSAPFVAINCAALAPTLLESELFGHEKGAFTGATERKIGKFELANGGTLMLDEIGEMSAEIQAKFLRALEGQPFERLGGSKPIQTNARIVAATNRDLEEAVKEGSFRADLYFRLRVIEILVPPLRQRPEDLLPLANHFLKTISARLGHGPEAFTPTAELAIQSHSWPGNIRELKNAVERAVVLSTDRLAQAEDLALSNLNLPESESTGTNNSARVQRFVYEELSLAELERDHIMATLTATEGNKSRAASILGIERSTLDRKLKKFENQ